MWGSSLARKWGAQAAVTLNDGKGQGNNIAVFPTYVQGICAQLDLWRTSKNYRNKRFSEAIAIWSGHNEVESYIAFVLARVPGMTRNTVMDDAFWHSPKGVAFLKAQAWHEAGMRYPAPDADWLEAQRTVFGDAPAAPEAPKDPPVTPPHEEEEGLPIPPVVVTPPTPTPSPAPAPAPAPVLPWYQRAWKWAAGSLFGSGIVLGGIQVNADTLLALSLLIVVVGTGVGVYFIGKHKNWWS